MVHTHPESVERKTMTDQRSSGSLSPTHASGYGWRMAAVGPGEARLPLGDTVPATKSEVEAFLVEDAVADAIGDCGVGG